MRGILGAAAIAAALLSAVMVASPAEARGKKTAQPSGRALACWKQAGASLDPVTKRWTFYTTERDGMSRQDMLRRCLAGGDMSKARGIALRERALNPGGAAPSRY